jgi:phosphoribosylaminoimidazole (AIR) synthetase
MLLEPHRSYLDALTPVLATGKVKALAHVTGGGLPENLPRVLPAGLGARVELGSWPIPPLFALVRELTSTMSTAELYRTLNMGIGMVVVCSRDDADDLRTSLGEPTWVIGEVTDGFDGVQLC